MHTPLFTLSKEFPRPKPHLAYWEDFLTSTDINHLLNLPEWNLSNPGTIGMNGEQGFMAGVDPNIRRSNVAWAGPTQRNEGLYKTLNLLVNQVNDDYFGFDLTGFYEPVQLTTYTEQQQDHYDWHVDAGYHEQNGPQGYRKLSVSILLSDPSEFEGGQLQVQIGGEAVTLDAKQGRAWFFPSYCVHRVTPVTKGVRKSLVLWVAGPAFR